MRPRVWAGVLAGCLVTGAAGADLPPPQGMKQVAFSFEVNGLGAFGDWVLLGFPLRGPAGDVTRGFTHVEDGKRTRVDRRNGTPKFYAMKRQAYESWLAKYRPATDPHADPALDALFASAQVVACNASPRPVNLLRSEDPRNEIVETFRVKALNDKRCELELASGSAPSTDPDASPPAGPDANPNASPPASPRPAPSASQPAAKPGGCGACALSATREAKDGALASWLGALALWAGALTFRGRGRGRARRRR